MLLHVQYFCNMKRKTEQNIIFPGRRVGAVGKGTRVWAGRSRSFCLPKCPDRLWGATQSPVQWVPRCLFPRGRDLTLTSNIHLAPKLGMSGAVPPGPQMSWRPVQGPVTLAVL